MASKHHCCLGDYLLPTCCNRWMSAASHLLKCVSTCLLKEAAITCFYQNCSVRWRASKLQTDGERATACVTAGMVTTCVCRVLCVFLWCVLCVFLRCEGFFLSSTRCALHFFAFCALFIVMCFALCKLCALCLRFALFCVRGRVLCLWFAIYCVYRIVCAVLGVIFVVCVVCIFVVCCLLYFVYCALCLRFVLCPRGDAFCVCALWLLALCDLCSALILLWSLECFLLLILTRHECW